MMYLPEDKWSSRYEQQFYTINMKAYAKLDKAPTKEDNFTQDACQFICGKPKYPAIYYTIEVSCGTEKHTCLRRYSQFQQLCNKFDPNRMFNVRSKLPSKTGLFHKDTEEFLDERMSGLYVFLSELLTRQEAVGSPLVEKFLELDVFRKV